MDGRITELADPAGNATINYFWSRQYDPAGLYDGENGLPFTKLDLFSIANPPNWGGRFLSQQAYLGTPAIDCPDAPLIGPCSLSGGSLLRSTYVRYERDKLPASLAPPDYYVNTNRRMASRRTVYEDDGQRDIIADSFNFDGLGHYRTTVTAGSADLGAEARRTTDYNPWAGTYKLDSSGTFDYTSTDSYPEFPGDEAPPHSFLSSGVPQGAAWDLDRFDYERQDQYDPSQSPSLSSARQDSCFDANGFLTRKRIYKDGIASGPNDLVTVFTPDSSGNVARERYYGGDTKPILTDDLCSSWQQPTKDSYTIAHTYQYGSLQASQYLDENGVPLGFYLVDRDIDSYTGLVKASRDSAGIQTTFSYDDMGRLTSARPDTGQGAWMRYNYFPFQSFFGNPAQVEAIASSNDGLLALSQNTTIFDGFGRVATEQRLMPDGNTSQRTTTYNALGWKIFVSE